MAAEKRPLGRERRWSSFQNVKLANVSRVDKCSSEIGQSSSIELGTLRIFRPFALKGVVKRYRMLIHTEGGQQVA